MRRYASRSRSADVYARALASRSLPPASLVRFSLRVLCLRSLCASLFGSCAFALFRPCAFAIYYSAQQRPTLYRPSVSSRSVALVMAFQAFFIWARREGKQMLPLNIPSSPSFKSSVLSHGPLGSIQICARHHNTRSDLSEAQGSVGAAEPERVCQGRSHRPPLRHVGDIVHVLVSTLVRLGEVERWRADVLREGETIA